MTSDKQQGGPAEQLMLMNAVLIVFVGAVLFACLGGAIGLGVALVVASIQQAIGISILTGGLFGLYWLNVGQLRYAKAIIAAIKESREDGQ